jgi:hypothetical protein
MALNDRQAAAAHAAAAVRDYIAKPRLCMLLFPSQGVEKLKIHSFC